MYGDEDPGQCEEIVGDVEGEPPQWCPVPGLTESHQRELREEEEAASSPANCEREEGGGNPPQKSVMITYLNALGCLSQFVSSTVIGDQS